VTHIEFSSVQKVDTQKSLQLREANAVQTIDLSRFRVACNSTPQSKKENQAAGGGFGLTRPISAFG